MTSAFWFRRDLRLQDNEALSFAAQQSPDQSVAAVYLQQLDSFEALSVIRQHSLVESIRSLQLGMAGKLNLRVVANASELANRLIEFCRELEVTELHASRMFDPDSIDLQNAVGLALKDAGIYLRLTGSNYAVAPGTVRKPDSTAYKVYTPFYRAWLQQLDTKVIELPTKTVFVQTGTAETLKEPSGVAPFTIRAGEEYAAETFAKFRKRALHNYDQLRDRADLSGTSHLSHALAHGELHPRTLLSKLGDSDGEIVFAKEICWREFYADVLFHNPHSLNDYYDERFAKMRYDRGSVASKRFEAWATGNTGYPMVDAGMRQLASEGWMHNRVRMIVASFLVKDLHLEWQQGAAHFERLLTDFDPASNAHGWQWTAGSGTDASPYYRVFTRVTQGYKFDPNGDYVRKYIEELRHIEGKEVHEPWNLDSGYSHGYAQRIVDHAKEREESLARLEELKQL